MLFLLLQKIEKYLHFCIDMFLVISVLIFWGSINIGIFGRMASYPIPWVEDLCKFSLPWLAILGFVKSINEDDALSIKFIFKYIFKNSYLIQIIIDIIICIVGILLSYHTFKELNPILGRQIVSSMRFLQMKFFYSSLLIGGTLISLFSVKNIIKIIIILIRKDKI